MCNDDYLEYHESLEDLNWPEPKWYVFKVEFECKFDETEDSVFVDARDWEEAWDKADDEIPEGAEKTNVTRMERAWWME